MCFRIHLQCFQCLSVWIYIQMSLLLQEQNMNNCASLYIVLDHKLIWISTGPPQWIWMIEVSFFLYVCKTRNPFYLPPLAWLAEILYQIATANRIRGCQPHHTGHYINHVSGESKPLIFWYSNCIVKGRKWYTHRINVSIFVQHIDCDLAKREYKYHIALKEKTKRTKNALSFCRHNGRCDKRLKSIIPNPPK